jgi:hypothetical protein
MRRNLKTDLISLLQFKELKLLIVSSQLTLGNHYSCYFSFTTHQVTKNKTANSIDMLVSQMIMVSSYIASEL